MFQPLVCVGGGGGGGGVKLSVLKKQIKYVIFSTLFYSLLRKFLYPVIIHYQNLHRLQFHSSLPNLCCCKMIGRCRDTPPTDVVVSPYLAYCLVISVYNILQYYVL